MFMNIKISLMPKHHQAHRKFCGCLFYRYILKCQNLLGIYRNSGNISTRYFHQLTIYWIFYDFLFIINFPRKLKIKIINWGGFFLRFLVNT